MSYTPYQPLKHIHDEERGLYDNDEECDMDPCEDFELVAEVVLAEGEDECDDTWDDV